MLLSALKLLLGHLKLLYKHLYYFLTLMLNPSLSAAILQALKSGGTITPTGSLAVTIQPITSIKFYPKNPLVDPANSSPSATFNAGISQDSLYIFNNLAININVNNIITYNYAALLDSNSSIVIVSKLPTPLVISSSGTINIAPNEFNMSFVNL